MLNLFNQCLVDNELPDEWKTAEVTMLHKKEKNKKDINNYRPISKTPCVAKLLERIISVRLWDFLKEKKIIISCQSGFRQNRQTKDNIFHLTQKATEALNRSNKLCAIFFDIAAAFDKVWHNGLIYKLAQMECPLYLVRFFVSFLKDRKFRVKVNEFISSEFSIKTGVPQGAVNSPVLFSIFINDIPTNKKKLWIHSMLFADDLVYYYMYKSNPDLVSKNITMHLKTIEEWLNKWRLRMAPHKCSYTIFNSGKKDISNELNLTLNNVKLTHDANPTFLGVRFDPQLSFKNQIAHLKQTCIQRLNIIKIMSHLSHLHKYKIAQLVASILTR